LEPEDFGLLAMVTIFAGLAKILNDFGFSNALIQKEGVTESHKSTVFWMNMVIGVFLTLLFIILSPFVASFYDEPRIIPIMNVLAFTFVIRSTFLVHFALLRKQIRFKELSIRLVITSIFTSVLTIIAAFLGFGVWALVFQSLCTSIVEGILIWYIFKWKPKWTFSYGDLKDLAKFSINVSFVRIGQYIVRKLDILLVGKFFGPAALGIYNRAFKFQMIPFRTVKTQIGTVLFPILSKLQSDFSKQRDIYLKLTGALALAMIPTMLGVFLIAEEFVLGVLGEKWEQLIFFIQVLTFASCFGAIGYPGALWMANDKTSQMLKITTINQFIRIIAILLGIWSESLNTLILLVGAAYVIDAITTNYLSAKVIHLPIKKLIFSFLPFIVISGIALFTTLLAHQFLFPGANYLVSFLLKFSLFSLTYLSFIMLLKPAPYQFIIDTLKPIILSKLRFLNTKNTK
jgi:PST family polysaccharide transporter